MLILGLTCTTGFSSDIAAELLCESETGKKPVIKTSCPIASDGPSNPASNKKFEELREIVAQVLKPATDLERARVNHSYLLNGLPDESLDSLEFKKAEIETQFQELSAHDGDAAESYGKKCSKKYKQRQELAAQKKAELARQLEELNRKISCYEVLETSIRWLTQLNRDILGGQRNAATDTKSLQKAIDKLPKLLEKATSDRRSQCDKECAAIDSARKFFLSKIEQEYNDKSSTATQKEEELVRVHIE